LELAASHASEIVAKLEIINDLPGSRKAGVLVEEVRGLQYTLVNFEWIIKHQIFFIFIRISTIVMVT
jgi:hypothetical protein